MKKYEYSKTEKAVMEKSAVPFAVYQFIDKKVTTVLVSDGFVELMGFESREDAVWMMDNDMYHDSHPDDIARIADDALRFALGEAEYNVVYRSKKNNGTPDEPYHIIHAFGRHIYPRKNVRLAMVWYVDEGEFIGEGSLKPDSISKNFSFSLNVSSLLQKSNYDFLTGISNMDHFFELAGFSKARAASAGKEVVVGFANINGMKFYNRRFGFAGGDKLLRDFANLLIRHFGSENCCRLGQDNFAFLAFSEDAEKRIYALFKDFDRTAGEMNVSVRIGLYPDSMGAAEISIACDRAKYACNRLRNSNKNNFIYFDKEMLAYETNRQYIIDNLDRAIKEGWIQAYYQPIVRAANGRVCDEEALARWIDPVKGMLSPAQFIPILEDSKLIYKVDLHMVDMILDKMKKQKARGIYVVPISVNLSRTDFDACDIVYEITKRVDMAGIGREMLTIEITESVVGTDFDFIKEQVEKFQNLGFKVWMDDFGSGYSSLDVLQSIRFDLIKLDMRFMQQFENENSKVILTELMKMALGLGLETVCEGVETKEQVDFLAEIGCTKLQGYYYTKPISFDQIMKRYLAGVQIGFENPAESDYYGSIGRINLYDMAVIANDDPEAFDRYFNMLPMAVIETDEKTLGIVRCNHSYREFLKRSFGGSEAEKKLSYEAFGNSLSPGFANALKKIHDGDDRAFIEEKINRDSVIHAFARRIAINPVNGVVACAIVVFGITKENNRSISYADMANSLSSDYIYLYYVNLETEEFVEYRSDPESTDLAAERHGGDFFAESLKDARVVVCAEDADRFIASFTRENILNTINEHGAYTITYRIKINGNKCMYVSMKAVKMSSDDNYLIIGVNNVDAYMRQQEAMERMREEQVTYARISALTGNYVCVYIVDPKTDEFKEYGATFVYEGLGLPKDGKDFFRKARRECLRTLYEEDQELFMKEFKKRNIMKTIKEDGVFMLRYRLMLDGKPTLTGLKAALVYENDGTKLVIGVSNIDKQQRKQR